jgi:organic hydroperoxide reductase OsmC/OhrA
MKKIHHYRASVEWKGNLGNGTAGYRSYSRDHQMSIEGKPILPGSSDVSFNGDGSRYTPEDLLVASLSACHMLWYLHLCAINGVVVAKYTDDAEADMAENEDGSGQFVQVILHPKVTVTRATMVRKAESLHEDANRMCFIARSINFPVQHIPQIACYENARNGLSDLDATV